MLILCGHITFELTDDFQASLKTKTEADRDPISFIRGKKKKDRYIKEQLYEFLLGLAHSTLESHSLRETCLYTSASHEIGSL